MLATPLVLEILLIINRQNSGLRIQMNFYPKRDELILPNTD
jgi:hypothetical protein